MLELMKGYLENITVALGAYICRLDELKMRGMKFMANMSRDERNEYYMLVVRRLDSRKSKAANLLKKFSHPKCLTCYKKPKEFGTRYDYVLHCLTPNHFRRLDELLTSKCQFKNGVDIIREESVEISEVQEEECMQINENALLELKGDLSDADNRIPPYNPARTIGATSMKQITAFYCKVCDRVIRRKNDVKVCYFNVVSKLYKVRFGRTPSLEMFMELNNYTHVHKNT